MLLEWITVWFYEWINYETRLPEGCKVDVGPVLSTQMTQDTESPNNSNKKENL